MTLSLKESVTDLEIRLAEAQRRAEAEAAHVAAFGDGGPWAGAMRKRDELETELRDLKLQIRGHQLGQALAELAEIDAELSRCEEQRRVADHSVRQMAQDETVRRYLNAPSVCMRMGWGYSWQKFTPWYESGKPRFTLAYADCTFFLDSDEAFRAGVRFDTSRERQIVMRYAEAKSQAEVALLALGAAADRRARLLQQHPELKAR